MLTENNSIIGDKGKSYEKLSAEQKKLVSFLCRDGEFELVRLRLSKKFAILIAKFFLRFATKASPNVAERRKS